MIRPQSGAAAFSVTGAGTRQGISISRRSGAGSTSSKRALGVASQSTTKLLSSGRPVATAVCSRLFAGLLAVLVEDPGAETLEPHIRAAIPEKTLRPFAGNE